MSKTKPNKKVLIAIGIFLVLVIAVTVIYFVTRPKASAGGKNITVAVILLEGDDIIHKISTDAEFLSDALSENSLVPSEDIAAGFVTTIDGITADISLEQWWMFTVNGEFSNYGINEAPVEDGCSYEFTLTEGWDM